MLSGTKCGILTKSDQNTAYLFQKLTLGDNTSRGMENTDEKSTWELKSLAHFKVSYTIYERFFT